MRREKRLAENEARYRAEQDRRRTAKYKRNSNSSPGLDADHPLGGEYTGGRTVTAAAGSFPRKRVAGGSPA